MLLQPTCNHMLAVNSPADFLPQKVSPYATHQLSCGWWEWREGFEHAKTTSVKLVCAFSFDSLALYSVPCLTLLSVTVLAIVNSEWHRSSCRAERLLPTVSTGNARPLNQWRVTPYCSSKHKKHGWDRGLMVWPSPLEVLFSLAVGS